MAKKETITRDHFLERCNGAPLDLDEVAQEAVKVSDDGTLSASAKLYLKAKENFETALELVGHEFG